MNEQLSWMPLPQNQWSMMLLAYCQTWSIDNSFEHGTSNMKSAPPITQSIFKEVSLSVWRNCSLLGAWICYFGNSKTPVHKVQIWKSTLFIILILNTNSDWLQVTWSVILISFCSEKPKGIVFAVLARVMYVDVSCQRSSIRKWLSYNVLFLSKRWHLFANEPQPRMNVIGEF